jgi:drug/metabolite transporter (DMT)-like permease
MARRREAALKRSVGFPGLVPALFLLLWSSGFAVAKLALQYTGPMTLIALRFALVVVVLLPVALVLRPSWPRGIALRHVVVVGLCMQVVYFGLSYQAMAMAIPASTVALIATLQPLLVGVFAPRFTGERVGALRWTGLILGFGGAGLVIGSQFTSAALPPAAVGFALASLVGLTAGTLYQKRFGAGAHPVSVNIIQHAVAAVVLTPPAIVLEGFAFDPHPEFVGAILYLVVVNSIISLSLLYALIRQGEVAAVSSLFFLVPPLAALIAWPLVGEALGALAWVGMLLAVAGVALANKVR